MRATSPLRSLTNDENSLTDPTPESLERIAVAVELPIEYFYQTRLTPCRGGCRLPLAFQDLGHPTRCRAVLGSAGTGTDSSLIDRHFSCPSRRSRRLTNLGRSRQPK